MQLNIITPLNATYLFFGFNGLHEVPEVVNGMHTCYVYMTDAALEKTFQGRYYLDALVARGYTTVRPGAESWNFHIVVPKDQPLF